ncbi:MAG TPA: hypothetical protein VJT73_20270 [Polyangiaceae bacterium]|nr:hypothetical protein [Polyangiaceae bacterium]
MTSRLSRALSFLRHTYLAVDARTLALFRVCFGLHLIANVYDRTKGLDGVAFYTNDGVLPNHFALYAPLGEKIWSLLFPFSSPGETRVAFFFILVVYAAYVVGYRTKLAQVLVVVCLLSLTNRNLMLQNGGIVVTNVVATWTLFLPLGARFSVDHFLRSLRERRESTASDLADRAAMVRSPPSFVRVAFLGILLNFACIYFFNYAHKQGVTWRDGSAVHWVLWQNRIATVWAAWLRMHEPGWLSPILTRGTLVIEALIPLWLLVPTFTKWTRRLAIASIIALHSGISLMMTLGPFSYSMMSFSLLLVSRHDWELAGRLITSKGPKLRVAFDRHSGASLTMARWLARLDVRGAIELAEGDDPGSVEALRLGPLAAYCRDPDRWVGGAGAMTRIVRALPFGAVFSRLFRGAWLAEKLGIFATRIGDREVAPGGPAPTLEQPVAPATALRRGLFRASGEFFALLLLATIGVQIMSDNWAIPDSIRLRHRPEFMRQIVEYLRLPQGWSMFSPDAPKDDGTIVIDALLSDGRHIDPRKQLPPDFDAAFHGPWFDDQQWCDWDLRMKFEGNKFLYPNFRDYIARLDRLSTWRQHATIESFEVYWVNNAAPPPGSTMPYAVQRHLLFSSSKRP